MSSFCSLWTWWASSLFLPSLNASVSGEVMVGLLAPVSQVHPGLVHVWPSSPKKGSPCGICVQIVTLRKCKMLIMDAQRVFGMIANCEPSGWSLLGWMDESFTSSLSPSLTLFPSLWESQTHNPPTPALAKFPGPQFITKFCLTHTNPLTLAIQRFLWSAPLWLVNQWKQIWLLWSSVKFGQIRVFAHLKVQQRQPNNPLLKSHCCAVPLRHHWPTICQQIANNFRYTYLGSLVFSSLGC